MQFFIDTLVPLFDLFFLGISAFIASYLLITGFKKRFNFNLFLGSVLFMFTLELAFALLESKLDRALLPVSFNFNAIGSLIVFGYSFYIIQKRLNTKLVLLFSSLILLIVLVPFCLPILPENIELNISTFVSVVSTISLVSAFLNLKKHENNLKNYYGSVLQKDMAGLRFIIIVMLVYSVTCLINYFLLLVWWDNPFSILMAVISFFYFDISIILIAVYTLNNQPFLKELDVSIEKAKEVEVKSDEMNNLADKQLFLELQKILDTESLYLDPNLSLGDLSLRFKVKSNVVSNSINEFSGTNFYGFINGYRVEHFKRLVIERRNVQMSIDGLSENCGFKSKSSFYNHFRRIEGGTPLQFINGLKNS